MMQNEMIHTGRVLIVEGKYDAARLAHLTDAMILLTDGFGIYKDKKRQQLFKALAQKNGLILPVVTLGLYPMAYITRLTRSSMLDVLGQDYIRTARAKGLSEKVVVFRHALKNSLIPVVTIFGASIPNLFGGAYITEKVFGWPGMGLLGVDAINNRDYQVLMGLTLFTAVLVLLGNLLADILYSVVDPRIRY